MFFWYFRVHKRSVEYCLLWVGDYQSQQAKQVWLCQLSKSPAPVWARHSSVSLPKSFFMTRCSWCLPPNYLKRDAGSPMPFGRSWCGVRQSIPQNPSYSSRSWPSPRVFSASRPRKPVFWSQLTLILKDENVTIRVKLWNIIHMTQYSKQK